MKTKLLFFSALILVVLTVSAHASYRQAAKLGPEPKDFKVGGNADHGKELYNANACMTCHGSKGNGKGIAGKDLTPPPADFTNSAEMKSKTDWRMYNVIKNGGEKVGLSASMAAYGSLSDQDLKDLVAYIRSLSATK